MLQEQKGKDINILNSSVKTHLTTWLTMLENTNQFDERTKHRNLIVSRHSCRITEEHVTTITFNSWSLITGQHRFHIILSYTFMLTFALIYSIASRTLISSFAPHFRWHHVANVLNLNHCHNSARILAHQCRQCLTGIQTSLTPRNESYELVNCSS